MFWLMRGVMVVGLLVVLAGCASVASLISDAKEKVEVLIGEQGAGTYTVTLDKDGAVLMKQQMRCDKGADGKMAGCHKL